MHYAVLVSMVLAGFVSAAPPVAGIKPTIAVMDFNPNNTSAGDSAVVSSFVRSAMVNSGEYMVIEKNNMDKLLAEQAFQQTGCSSKDCAVRLGKVLNVKKMVVGEYAVLDSVRFLTASLVDVESGQIEKTARMKGFQIGEADRVADDIVAQMVSGSLYTPSAWSGGRRGMAAYTESAWDIVYKGIKKIDWFLSFGNGMLFIEQKGDGIYSTQKNDMKGMVLGFHPDLAFTSDGKFGMMGDISYGSFDKPGAQYGQGFNGNIYLRNPHSPRYTQYGAALYYSIVPNFRITIGGVYQFFRYRYDEVRYIKQENSHSSEGYIYHDPGHPIFYDYYYYNWHDTYFDTYMDKDVLVEYNNIALDVGADWKLAERLTFSLNMEFIKNDPNHMLGVYFPTTQLAVKYKF